VPSKTLGLENDTVKLVTHQTAWHEQFLEEQKRLREALGDAVLDIQHIGSTAIPGISAKPLLDLGIAVQNFEEAFVCVQPLEKLGYIYRGENGIPRRHYFVKGSSEKRMHHLHVLEQSSPEWRKHLLFRDYLCAHPEALTQYQALKTRLAEQFPKDREAYTEGKHAFIQDILNRAE